MVRVKNEAKNVQKVMIQNLPVISSWKFVGSNHAALSKHLSGINDISGMDEYLSQVMKYHWKSAKSMQEYHS